MLAGDNGQTTKDKSTSVVFASDHDALPTTVAGGATAANQTSELTKLDTVITNTARLAALGPGPGSTTGSASKIFNVAFGASANVNIDLTLSAYAGLKTAIDNGKLLMLKATTQCWYNWATSNIAIAAASTQASGAATQGVPMFDGGESPERAPSGSTVLNILGGSAAGMLCIYLAE